MEDNKVYVVDKSSGEALEIEKNPVFDYLIGSKIIEWNEEFECYVFDNKNKKFIYNESIEKIFNGEHTINTIVRDILNGLDKIKYNTPTNHQDIYNTISIFKDDYKVIINKSGVEFFNFLGAKKMVYYVLNNTKIFNKVVDYVDNMLEEFIQKIAVNGDLNEFDKKLFDEITIGNPNIMAKYVSDKISIENIFGYTCLIKNSLINRLVTLGRYNRKIWTPSKNLTAQSYHMTNLLRYFKRK